MPSKIKMMKQKWYPRPHEMEHSYLASLEGGWSVDTIYPIVMYDEGLGAPSSYNAHPEHASFSTTDAPNCFPDSRVDNISCHLQFEMTKGAITTDSAPAVRVGFMPIMMSFKDDYIAIDELTSEEVQDVLELQTESTDRQGYPLYNGNKITEKFTGSGTLAAAVPGLTTTQVLEAVAFDYDAYYDMLQYKTNSGKLRNCSGGIKWVTLTKSFPLKNFKINLRSKTKRLNPYTFFGVAIIIPQVGTHKQIPVATDTTAVQHVGWNITTRYHEWSQAFDMEKL